MIAAPWVAMVLAATPQAHASEVTPVRGPSWIQHLGIDLDATRMGKVGGEGPPPPADWREPMPSPETGRETMSGLVRRFLSRLGSGESGAEESLDAPFTLVGRDLYRLNCRSCHGSDGRGAQPEINSLLDPVRATSPTFIEEHQRQQGRRLPPGMAQQLAADAEKTLLDRLANGGKKMPFFHHLAGDEVAALFQYLRTLSGVSAPDERPLKVTESVVRVGEHLVKGTCHICHAATGPGASHMMMHIGGVIPSLASLPAQMSPTAVLWKVRAGASGGMGMGGMMARMSRMPVFDYVTAEEVLAAYIYLSRYPPLPE